MKRELVAVFEAMVSLTIVACRDDTVSPATPTAAPARPATAAATTLSFRQVSAGWEHTCGVTTDDRAYCWGNTVSELGTGTSEDVVTTPTAVAGGHRFRSVSAGASFTCGVTTDDRLYCWGNNYLGQLGTGDISAPAQTPTPVATSRRFSEVSAGWEHSCAVATDARVYCWGHNSAGQLGDGTDSNRVAPVPVARSLRFSHVDAGNYHTCGVTMQNHAYCWGDNSYGQLGIRGGGRDWQHARLRPTVAAGGLKFREVNAGYFDTCGVTTDDQAYCWGKNGPELGSVTDSVSDFERTPRLVDGGLAFRSVDPSFLHTCGVTTDDVAYCWGTAAFGNGLPSDTRTPVQVAGELRFRQVSTGYYHACGVTTDNEFYCWGANFAGQLGNGTRDEEGGG